MQHRVYLAGPDVFMPDAAARAAALKGVCARHGLLGVSPLDTLADEPPDWADLPAAYRIARRNEAHIRASDAIIANLTPFRGPGADAGTVYEVGFGRALGLPVFGFTTLAQDYAARVRSLPGCGATRDADGLEIEDFGLFENLMIACAIAESGGVVVAEAADRWGGLVAFERCVAMAAKALGAHTGEG
jgi:nucleoside 2-deoxyribosyltransferase